MDEHAQLRYLLDLAETAGIVIRRAPALPEGEVAAGRGGQPGGALVRLRGKEMLFLDPGASLADRIAVVAAALAGRSEIEDRFLPPEIRRRIDQAQAPD